MPEIWLNYGTTDVVLDIKAENLDQKIDSDGNTLNSDHIGEKLDILDTSKPTELVLLHYTKSIQKIINELFLRCEQKSQPIPKILADKRILHSIKTTLPEGSVVSAFDLDQLNHSNLVFVGEMELDGLFGYETIATRLMRNFGKENMLNAYAKRKSNLPAPAQLTECLNEAKKFSDNFEITGIEILANSKGIVDFEINHPAKTIGLVKKFESFAIKDTGSHKSLIVSTGKEASNLTLDKSLNSLWNCYDVLKDNGLAILLAECRFGLGSEAIQQFVEDRLTLDVLKNPTTYISGIENLLFLSEIKERYQLGLVSILPEFYVKKLGLIPLNGIKSSLDYILKTQGSRQKISIVIDGARVMLR